MSESGTDPATIDTRAPSHHVVIYQSADREGSTFELSRESLIELRQSFPQLRVSPRVFVAHGTRDDFERLHGTSLAQQIAILLTGLPIDRLGTLEFRDPVTERTL